MEDLIELFEQYIKQTDRGPSAKYYLSDLKKFMRWFKEPVTSVAILDLIEYRKYLQKSGGRNGKKAKASTVNRSLTSLSIFFKWALSLKIIQHDPTEGLKSVKEEELAPRWLNRKEQARFMRAVQANPRDLIICGLMLHAGLRVSEVCNLQGGDLVIKNRSGHVIIRKGKGNKQRIVPLNNTLRQLLTNYEKDGIFLKSKKGGDITPRGIQHMVSKYAYLARLDNVTPHVLRHTFCKNLIDMGVTLDKVALLAGHTSLNVTKRYITPSRDDLQEAVETIAWN